MTLTIYGDSSSGNCAKVRWVAELQGVPYRWRETSVLKGETRTPDFLALSRAGQVPMVVLADGRVLSQSNAIMMFLAENSALIPQDSYERAQMMQWLFWEQYSHEPAIAVLRYQRALLKKSTAEISPDLLPRSERALTVMDDHLSARPWFVGRDLTLADIALVAYTRLADDAGIDLARWPSVAAWVARTVARLPVLPAAAG